MVSFVVAYFGLWRLYKISLWSVYGFGGTAFCNTDKKKERPKMHRTPMNPNFRNLPPTDRSRGCFKKMVLFKRGTWQRVSSCGSNLILELRANQLTCHDFSELQGEFTGVLISELSLSLSLVIVAMYRSPSGHANVFLSLLELWLTYLVSLNYSVITGTDHNINLLSSTRDRDEPVQIELCKTY